MSGTRTNGITEDDTVRRFSRLRTGRNDRNGADMNINTNNSNNNDVSKTTESRFSNYSRNANDFSHRSGGSRLSGGPRKKSALVQSMAANFEQKKAATTNTSAAPPMITISAAASPAKTNHSTDLNINSMNKRNTETTKLENGNTLKPEEDDESSQPAPKQKSGLSARRGKQQREKRMLRQKRRSTGVVRLQESDDEETKEKEKAKEKESKEEKEIIKKDEEETVLHLSETEINTKSNELSPPINKFQSLADRFASRPENLDQNHGSSSLKSNLKQSSSSSIHSYASQAEVSDSVFLSPESQPKSTIPALNSSRRRVKYSSSDKAQDDLNEKLKRENEELKDKLTSAELAVTKLTREIDVMDSDLKHLEEENERLKGENKMLEDENLTMLRLMRR